jgi:hypothetical protein
MSMPETSVDEYRRLVLRKYQIRAAWQPLDMETIPETSRMQVTSHDHLGLRVFTSDAAHQPTALFIGQLICHT